MKPISVTSSCPDNDKAQVEQRIINNCFTPATDSCSLRYQPLSLNYFFRPHETHFCTVVLWCTGNGLEFIEFWEYWADMLAYDGLLDRRIDRDGAGCETKLSHWISDVWMVILSPAQIELCSDPLCLIKGDVWCDTMISQTKSVVSCNLKWNWWNCLIWSNGHISYS